MIEDLPKVWRILAGLVPIQILGSIIGLAIGYHYSAFNNLCMGAAVATPIGLIIGSIWHLKAHQKPKPYLTVIFLVSLALLLAIAVIFFDIPSSIQEMKHLEEFQNLSSKNIKQIIVYDEHGEKLIKKIIDPDVLKDFKSACSYTKGYTPNHPYYISSWYVRIIADKIIEIECHYQEGRSSLLIGYFVNKVGPSAGHHGSFYNSKLRVWFEKNIENR